MERDLLTELHQRGIKLRLSDGRLDVLAPPGSLTSELRDELRQQRADLIALLRRTEPGGLPEFTPQPAQWHEPFPLTDVQQAYWVGRSRGVELGGVFTHFYLELEGQGLDTGRLAESLRAVVARHGMLRAVIDPDGRQRVLPEVPRYDLAVTDLSGLPAEARETELNRIRTHMSHQSLTPEQWPLFDIRASVLPGGRLRLHVNIDNVIMDAVSLDVLFRDWRRFYDEPDWSPEPLAMSYRDVILAGMAQRDSGRHAAAEEYWLSRLETLPAAPALPLAMQPAQLGRPEFTHRHGRLPRDQWTAVKQMARQRGLTPSAVVMTAFADILRLWSRQPEFTLNLTLFNRPALHPQIGQVVGDFTSLSLLEVTAPQPGDPFTARSRRLNRQLMRDLEHLSYDGVRVLQERARRLAGAPAAAMPIVFTSGLVAGDDDTAGDKPSGRRLFGETLYSICETPQVWLDHQASEDQGELCLDWDAVEALFPDGMLDDIFTAYLGLLARLAAEQDAWDRPEPLAVLPPWQADKRARVNGTAARIPDRTLCDLAEKQAAARPDAVAVIGGDGSRVSYQELIAQGHRLGRRLAELGAARDTLIGVVLDKSPEQVAAVLGVTCSGAAYLPVDTQWPEARRHQLLVQGGARIVVTSPRLREELSWPSGTQVVTLADPEITGADPGPLSISPAPDDLAYVIFTSGSTGQPKGVMMEHRAAANTIQDINGRFGVGSGDSVLALSALSFDLSVYDIFGALAAGATIVIPAANQIHDPAAWTGLIKRYGVTIWNSVPALMQTWLEAAEADGPSPGPGLRLALLSGDWIPVWLPDAIRDRCPSMEVISLGGATEAAVWSVFYPVGKVPPEWDTIPYGRPLANQVLNVYDPQLCPVPVWVTGEIYIGGAGVARGYWADEARTAERFVTHPVSGQRLYRTGDLGRYLPGGDIEFLGREDFQVKLNGYRIELGEIAATLRRVPGIAEAFVTVATNPATGSRQLVGYVLEGQAPADGRPDPAVLRAALEDALPDYMVPRHYVFIDRIPLSANAKVDISALPAPWEAVAPAGLTAPADDVERKLLEIWSETLGREDFGVGDNLFELGGDSLHAVRILGRVRDEFGIDGSAEEGLQWIFASPTIAELAVTIRDMSAA